MHELSSIAVVGGGLMGAGIAAKLAAAGKPVIVFDTALGAAKKVTDSCSATFREMVQGGVLDIAQAQAAQERVRFTTNLHSLADRDLIFEAIFESLEAKRALYAQLENIVATCTLIASTTSGFTPNSLFENLKYRDRAMVAHFWNPPHLVPLVEVLASSWTGEPSMQNLMQFLRINGCFPVRLQKAIPGFIGNRIQFAVLREALHILQDGVADAETIDMVVRQTLGRRYRWIGPLEVADAGGLNTFLQIATHLMPQLSKDESALEILVQHVTRGETGHASNTGLLRWDEERKRRYAEVRLRMMESD